jgi:chloride channel 2
MVAINTLTMKIDNWKIQNRDNYANWMLCSAVCVLIAQGCVQFISPFAEGSGIP